MKMRLYYFSALAFAATLGLTSCSSNEESTSNEDMGTGSESCFYSYNEGSTNFEWTAYKTNDKVGVPGGFNEIEVTSEKGENPIDVLESIEFSMNTSSVETNNEDRNGKVAKHFFETINTDKITGKVRSLGEDGKATIEVTMNSITIDVDGNYTLTDGDFSFEATIDIVNWNGMSGIMALNEVCEDLHTGADGVSKLWSEVSLKLTTKLASDCN